MSFLEEIGKLAIITVVLFVLIQIIILLADTKNYGLIDGKEIKCLEWSEKPFDLNYYYDSRIQPKDNCILWEEITNIKVHPQGKAN